MPKLCQFTSVNVKTEISYTEHKKTLQLYAESTDWSGMAHFSEIY
jgi:hypothetical protein